MSDHGNISTEEISLTRWLIILFSPLRCKGKCCGVLWVLDKHFNLTHFNFDEFVFKVTFNVFHLIWFLFRSSRKFEIKIQCLCLAFKTWANLFSSFYYQRSRPTTFAAGYGVWLNWRFWFHLLLVQHDSTKEEIYLTSILGSIRVCWRISSIINTKLILSNNMWHFKPPLPPACDIWWHGPIIRVTWQFSFYKKT